MKLFLEKCRPVIFIALSQSHPTRLLVQHGSIFHGEEVIKRVKCDSHFRAVRQAKAESTASKHDTRPFLMGIDHHIVSKRSYPAWRLNGQVGCVNRIMRLYSAPQTCNNGKDLNESYKITFLNKQYFRSHSSTPTITIISSQFFKDILYLAKHSFCFKSEMYHVCIQKRAEHRT